MSPPAMQFTGAVLHWLRSLPHGQIVELVRRGEYVNVTTGGHIVCRLWYPMKRLVVEFPRCRDIAPGVPKPKRYFIDEGRRGQVLNGAPPEVSLGAVKWFFDKRISPKLPAAPKAKPGRKPRAKPEPEGGGDAGKQ